MRHQCLLVLALRTGLLVSSARCVSEALLVTPGRPAATQTALAGVTMSPPASGSNDQSNPDGAGYIVDVAVVIGGARQRTAARERAWCEINGSEPQPQQGPVEYVKTDDPDAASDSHRRDISPSSVGHSDRLAARTHAPGTFRWGGREVPLVRTPYGLLPAACVREHGDDLLRLEEDVAVYGNGSRQAAAPTSVAFCGDYNLKEALGFRRSRGWLHESQAADDRRRMELDPVMSGAGPLPSATYYQGATALVGKACNHSQLDTWTAVYSLPDRDPIHGTIDFWLGVEPVSTVYGKDGRCNGHAPGANLTVLQPVVSWFDKKWSAAAWNCCPQDQVHVGNRFHLRRPFPDVFVSIRRDVQGATEVFTVHMDAGFGGGQSSLAMMANGRLFGWFMAVQENHQLNETAECTQLLQPGDHFVFKDCALKLVGSHHTIRPNFTIRAPWHASAFAAKCGGGVAVSDEFDHSGAVTGNFAIEMKGPPALSPPPPTPALPPRCLAKMRALCSPQLGSSCLLCAQSHAKELADVGCGVDCLRTICNRGLHARVNLTITPTELNDRMLLSVSRAENSTYEEVMVLGLSSGKIESATALGTTVASKCYDMSDRVDDNYFVAGTRFGHYFGGALEFKSVLLQLRATGLQRQGSEMSLGWARWTSATTSDADSFNGQDGVRSSYPGNISRCDTWPACQAIGRDITHAKLRIGGPKMVAGELSIAFNGLCK
eukprot:SAG31_NODE_4000_length_3677_cov_4.657630_2_plen_717_part_00